MKKIVFITGVCGVGKTSIYENIKNSDLKHTYNIFDIDMLENVNDYKDNYDEFYKSAVDKAIDKSKDKDIILFSCINHNDISNLKLEDCITRIVLITCDSEELKKRLKDRNNDCSSDEFINEQIKYQEWFINNLDYYDSDYNNTDGNIDDICDKIIDFLDIFE